MSKYKIGDKFIIEIENNFFDGYKIKGFRTLVFDDYGLDKLQKINPQLKIEDIDDMLAEYELGKASYENGLYAGWNLSKKLFSEMSDTELNKIFGKGWSYPRLMELKPHEVLEKIEKYERSQIQVGDIIYCDDEPDSFGVVTMLMGGVAYILWDDGSCGKETNLGELHKTGRTRNILTTLKEIRGSE